VRSRVSVHPFDPRDIERACKALDCSRAQLAKRLGVSRACVSRWEKGLRAPQRGDGARLRTLLGESLVPGVNVFALRKKLGMTQRVFSAQFKVSRQQVQKWESGAAWPHRRQLEKLVKLWEVAKTPPLTGPRADMLTVSAAAVYSGITEKTLRKAIKGGRLPYTVDTSPGPWPKSGRYLLRQADLDDFRLNRYDPYFKKGRWGRAGEEKAFMPALVLPFSEGGGRAENA
jgi:DNA-binding transcriptional regulator YiaG